MSDLMVIHQRNKLMVKMIWLMFFADITINLLHRDFPGIKLLSLAAVPLLILITYFVKKKLLVNLTMYLMSVCLLTVLLILNLKDEAYINLFFLILPPILSVSYRDWKNILFTTVVSAAAFCSFFLMKGESYYTQWKPGDILYFLFFFVAFGILNIFETKFSEEIRIKLIDELDRGKQLQNDLQKQDQILHGAAGAMNCLLTKEDHSAGIQEALAIIGRAIQVDHVHIFENHFIATSREIAMSQRYVWTKAADSVELNSSSLQTIPYMKAGLSRWFEALSSGEIIQGPVRLFPMGEQRFLEPYGIKSLLVVPIFILNEFWGFIGFDDCENERCWNKREEITLLTMAAGIGGSIKQYQDENLLLESEEKYRLITDNMSDFVTVLDRDGKILYASPSHEKVLKIRMTDMIGAFLHEHIHPDDKQAFLKAFHNMLFQRLNLKIDVRWKFRERWINFAMRGRPVVEKNKKIQRVVIVARNITHRIKMEEKLKQTSAKLEALISNMPYGILAEDEKHRLIFLNQQYKEIFTVTSFSENHLGITADEIREQSRKMFLEEEMYIKRSKEIFAQCEKVLDEEWELRDGRIISCDAIPIFVNDQFDGFLWQFKDISEQKRIEKKFREASLLDGLTNIPNRRFFDETVAKEWGRCARVSKSLTLMMIDIDYFKKYNDTYGHQEGDECLIRVAQTIKAALLRPFDAVCRYGGEEFVVLLPETDREGGMKMAEKIRTAIESIKIPHATSTVSPYVTCSFGIATAIPCPLMNPEELIRRADKALYVSKTNGRNQVNDDDKEKTFNLN